MATTTRHRDHQTTSEPRGGGGKPFYITTTLPYVNAKPHLGHAMEFVRADIIARHKQLLSYDVFFNTGTDEHGLKVYEKAQEKGVDPQSYVDENVTNFRSLLQTLDLLPDIHFVRTTDEHHIRAAQEFWRRCRDDIYKGTYKVRYCVGCELEKTDSDLTADDRCPEHPDRELEIREEENYFFAFSRYGDKLHELYEANPSFVIPDFRFNEIKAFVSRGLEDFSISRLASRMPWGVPVPDDPDHVMYVWFDALTNYISTLGWPDSAKAPQGAAKEEGAFEKYWVGGTPTQYAGKDNLRQQAAMWQAMLMSAGLATSHQIVINGFIISGEQKMSKSLGNVIDPLDIVDKYGTDTLRYLVARKVNAFDDTSVSLEQIKEWYNADLANGLGNLVSRVLAMAEKYDVPIETPLSSTPYSEMVRRHPKYTDAIDSYQLNKAADYIWSLIAATDQFITSTEPFKKIKEDKEQAHRDIQQSANSVAEIALLLKPLMPETAAAITRAVRARQPFTRPLFLRIS